MKSNITLATTNPHKIKKLTWIVKPFFLNIQTQSGDIDIDEIANSFEGNAALKAIEVSKTYGGYAIATDGGVTIPSLKNWDSLLTKRFIGKDDATDFDRIDALIELMKDKTGDERRIVWREAIALAKDGKLLFSTEVDGDEGSLQDTYDKKHYRPGIWQCTITCYPQFGGKNFFELSEKEREYAEISWYRLRDAMSEYLQSHPSASNKD